MSELKRRSVVLLALVVALCATGGGRLHASPDAASGPPLTTERALDLWAGALGGRERLEKVRMLYLSGSLRTGGLEGTYKRWTTSTGSLKTVLEIPGVFRQVIVLRGREGWTMDGSGTVSDLAGGTLESVVSSAYEASGAFFFPGRLPGRVELASAQEGGGPILRLVPDGGTAVTVVLDERTFLPVREESRGPAGPRTITFADWKAFSGILYPGTVRQSNGDPRLDAVFTTSRVEINPEAPGDLFTRPAARAGPIAFARGTHRAVVPVEVSMQHVFVPVRVNGGTAGWFFLDSGAALSFVSPGLAGRSGLTVHGVMQATGTGAGSTTMGMAGPAVLHLPGVDVPMDSLAVWDFSSLLPALGRAWDGDLGHDVISRFVVRLDYERREITFDDPETFVPDPRAVDLPVTFMGTMPIVQGRILLPRRPPLEIACAIDSGAAGLHLSAPFSKTHHVADSMARTISASSLGAGGASKELAGRIEGLGLGPYLLRSPIVELSPDLKEGLLAGPEIGALVGGEILERFTVTFDYPHRRILLKPNGRFADPFLADESGLSMIATGPAFHRLEIDDVESGSPADTAGVRIGDVITAVDGRTAAELDLQTIGGLLQQVGRTIRMTLERGGKTLDVSLVLRERL